MEYNDKVKEYLARFPDIADILPKAIEAARKHFPDDEIVVDVYQDSEIDDSYIVINVKAKNGHLADLDLLADAEREYIDELANKKGWIQLTTWF